MKPVAHSSPARPVTTTADTEPLAEALDQIAARVEQGQDALQNLPLLEPKQPEDVDAYHPLHDFSARRRIDRNVGWIQQWLTEHADDKEAAPEGLKRTMEETLFMIPSADFTPAQTAKLKAWLAEKASGLVSRSPWWRYERRDRLETTTNLLWKRAGEVVTTEQRIECLWRRYHLLKSIGGSERDLRLNLYALYDVAEKSAGRDPNFHLNANERRALLEKVIHEQKDLLERLGGRNRNLEDTLFLSTRLLEKIPAEKPNAPATFSNTAAWKPLDAALAHVESGNIPEARRLLQQILNRPAVAGDAADRDVRNIARSVLVQETQARIDRTMALVGALSESRFAEERWSAGRDAISRVLRHVREYLRSLPPEHLPKSFAETLRGFAAKNPAYRQDYETFTLILNNMGGDPVWALVHAMDRVEEAGGVKTALAAMESILDKDTSYLRGHGDLEGALLSGAEMLKGYTNDRSLLRDIAKFQEKVPSYESWGRIFRETVSARTVLEIAFCFATGLVAGSAGRAAAAAMRTRLVVQVAGKGGRALEILEGLELGTFTRQTALIRAGMAASDVTANAGVFSLTSQYKDAMVDGRIQNPITAAGHSVMDIGLLQFTMSHLEFMHWAPRALLAGGSVMQVGKALRGEEVTLQGAFRDMAFALGNDFAIHQAAPSAHRSVAGSDKRSFGLDKGVDWLNAKIDDAVKSLAGKIGPVPKGLEAASVVFGGGPLMGFLDLFLKDARHFAEGGSLVGKIPGLTPELEHAFEKGQFVMPFNDRYKLMLTAFGETLYGSREVGPEGYAAYQAWQRERGFPEGDGVKGQGWSDLVDFGRRHGLAVQGQVSPSQANYLLEILSRLPASFLSNTHLKGITFNSRRRGAPRVGCYEEGHVYIFDYAMDGSRRNLMGTVLHEMGHSTAARYALNREENASVPGSRGLEPDGGIPMSIRRLMHEDVRTVTHEDQTATFALDWLDGRENRQNYTSSFSEFIAELHLHYVATGDQLRNHIRSITHQGQREAYRRIYDEIRHNVFGGREYSNATPVLDRMKDILGVTDDTYVYRASDPRWIQNGRIGLNQNSVALVHDPYNRPELLSDIQTAYSDANAAEALFDSMWKNGTKASALENPGLNVSTDEAEILARYGGGPGSKRALVRIRLGDIPKARLYPDVGGGTGDKTIFYVTGQGSSVPVEVYDHATRSWGKQETLVLATTEHMHARIEQMIDASLRGPGHESLRAKLRTQLRAEFSRVLQHEAHVDRLEDVTDSSRNQIVSTFESRAVSIVSQYRNY